MPLTHYTIDSDVHREVTHIAQALLRSTNDTMVIQGIALMTQLELFEGPHPGAAPRKEYVKG